jgi:surface protein
MEKTFYDQHNFIEEISGWNVVNVTNMSIICEMEQANSTNISGWDVRIWIGCFVELLYSTETSAAGISAK